MQNNENNYEGAKREERKKNKKIYLIAKENLVRDYPFMSFKKSLKVGPPSSTLFANIQLWPELNAIFIILISIIKLAAKQTDFHQVDICERLIYFQCLHYRTPTQL